MQLIVGNDSISTCCSSIARVGRFTHVAGVYDRASLRLFVNGVLAASKSTTVASVPTNSLNLRLGADAAGDNRFAGVIDEARVYARALSVTELMADYRAGSAAVCAP